MSPHSGPLGPGDLAALNGLLQSTAQTLAYLERCKKCGLPVEELIAKNLQQQAVAQSVKREFFPHEP